MALCFTKPRDGRWIQYVSSSIDFNRIRMSRKKKKYDTKTNNKYLEFIFFFVSNQRGHMLLKE